MVKNQKFQTWHEKISDNSRLEMASSEDKNAAGEVREAADGEVIKVHYLKRIGIQSLLSKVVRISGY